MSVNRIIDDRWDFGTDKEPLMHRIHTYPAKFPAFITPKAVDYARSNGVNVTRVADVFCGCGTTALETRRLGLDFWGCDINPVATLIAGVKKESYRPACLKEYMEDILRKFDKKSKKHLFSSDELPERIRYWYFPKQIDDLKRLKKAIDFIPKGKYRNFFLVAFSNILKPTSRWLTKSIKPQFDPNKKPAEVRFAFLNQFSFMFKAVGESLQSFKNRTHSNIETCNFLEKKIDAPFADLVITSPPYVTSYEYADLHQLSTLWLDYTDDYRKFRSGTIGSLYHESSFDLDIKHLNHTGEGIVFRLYNVERKKARATAKYFVDMKRTVKQCRNLLNPGGMAFFVIGNTEYKGVKVDNSQYLTECMIDEEFKDIHIFRRTVSGKILTPYRDNKGKFSADHNSRKVYSEEFILTGKKYAEI